MSRRRHAWISSEAAATCSAFALLAVAFMPVVSFGAIYPFLVEAGETADHGLATLTVVVFWVMGAAVSTTVGSLVDRFPLWCVTGTGVATMAIGLCFAGTIGSELAIVCGFGVLGGLGSCAVGSVPNFVAIARFVTHGRRRTMAMGIAAAGMGVSSLAIQPVGLVLSTAGVQAGLGFLAGLIVAVSAPFVYLYFRLERAGLQVQDPTPAGASSARRWSRRQAVRTKTFWLLCLAAFCAPAAIQVLLVHQVAIIQELGGTYAAGVDAATVLGVTSIGWRVIAGAAAGRMGRAQTYGIAVVLSVTALATLVTGLGGLPWPGRGYAYAVLFSAGYGAFASMFPAASIGLFGRESFAKIHGLLYAGLGLGAATGAWVGGWLRDISGAYETSLVFAVIALTVSGVAYAMSNAGERHVRRPNRERRECTSRL